MERVDDSVRFDLGKVWFDMKNNQNTMNEKSADKPELLHEKDPQGYAQVYLLRVFKSDGTPHRAYTEVHDKHGGKLYQETTDGAKIKTAVTEKFDMSGVKLHPQKDFSATDHIRKANDDVDKPSDPFPGINIKVNEVKHATSLYQESKINHAHDSDKPFE